MFSLKTGLRAVMLYLIIVLIYLTKNNEQCIQMNTQKGSYFSIETYIIDIDKRGTQIIFST